MCSVECSPAAVDLITVVGRNPVKCTSPSQCDNLQFALRKLSWLSTSQRCFCYLSCHPLYRPSLWFFVN